jgi:DNA-nicking Smr family endonuclease
MRDVVPLPPSGRRQRQSKAPVPEPRFSQADDKAVLDELLDHAIDHASLETGDELNYRQPGVQLGVIRKLRRGQYAVQGEPLDLHGMTAIEARAALADFLDDGRARGRRCVLVIHGKGLRSKQGSPVLKVKVALWLRQRSEVLAYCSARPVDGGTGAVYVLLKS